MNLCGNVFQKMKSYDRNINLPDSDPSADWIYRRVFSSQKLLQTILIKVKMELEFKKYKRKGLSEMVPFKEFIGQDMSTVSVSDQDKLLSNEEFELGYIARNPKNHADMWYVAKKYFDDNLEPA